MAKKSYAISEVTNQKWIKEGRGSGQGCDYKPWLPVRDLPSEGRSHRIFGHKSQRTHHLLSDLELAVFFILEWHIDTVDIREQFPLRLEDTCSIADEARIKHPESQGVLQIMSSDFLVNTRDSESPKFTLQAKYSEKLQDTRTIEKLEIERRYWVQKSVPWMLVTEKEIPLVIFNNIAWLYPKQQWNELEIDVMQERVAIYAHHFQKFPRKTIVEIAILLDAAYSLPPGQSLSEIRALLANRCFLFDIFVPYLQLTGGELQSENIVTMMEVLRVSNQ
ncbi:heteromeric transposase endonuclease subunit TnsA [Methylomonas sp. EFPC1]|uniref:TnsA endonuclease N-terminal domain-containing protein n=1 Tax=Methylomonas sp. EFPC1 TaxID=2812647 RepID=UPI001966D774|nr:TnsA endonuclease N-terminal domain-containing protein [Methylomonas sp. EFPC1]QSB01311.1 heteromeric transposase endonuclease subunit TnsA [Methylomonas sp. EFPC1]